MITLEQVNEFLTMNGITNIPQALVVALTERINSANDCLDANYDEYTKLLILYAALTILASLQTNQQLANQYADGAGRGFRYKDFGSYMRGAYSYLSGLDTAGCMGSIIPENPEEEKNYAFIGVARGGCHE